VVDAVLAFNKAEGAGFKIRRDTCSGGNQNQSNADYITRYYFQLQINM